ncbi:MAG: hypothetical protein ABIJ34_09540 [archaeon]
MQIKGVLEAWNYQISFVDPSCFRGKEDPPVNAFLDYELLSNMPLIKMNQLGGIPSFMFHHSRVYDATLRLHVEELHKLVKQNKRSEDDARLVELVDMVYELATPHGLIPAQAGMMGAHPSFLIDMACEAIEKINFAGGFPYLIQTKTSIEWTHKALYYLLSKGQHEAFMLKQMVARFVMHGLYGWAAMHPHAEDEDLFLAQKFGLPIFAAFNPQNGFRVNGIEVMLNKIFPKEVLEDPRDNPFGTYLLKKYSPQTTMVMSADAGALENVYLFTRDKAPGFRMFGSKGCRKSEGKKIYEGELSLLETVILGHNFNRNLYVDSIEDYLNEYYRAGKKDERLTIIIVDDKNNTMNTADGAAAYMKRRVKEFNDLHQTHYSLDVELWVTHMRTPDLDIVQNQMAKGNIKKVVCLNGTRYEPPLQLQIIQRGLENQITVLEDIAEYKAAQAIVALNAIHIGLYHDPLVIDSIIAQQSVDAPLRISPYLKPDFKKWG